MTDEKEMIQDIKEMILLLSALTKENTEGEDYLNELKKKYIVKENMMDKIIKTRCSSCNERIEIDISEALQNQSKEIIGEIIGRLEKELTKTNNMRRTTAVYYFRGMLTTLIKSLKEEKKNGK